MRALQNIHFVHLRNSHKNAHYFLEIELLDYESWNAMLEKSETEFLSLDHFWADILHC